MEIRNLLTRNQFYSLFSLFTEELEKARALNVKLSFGIGLFQGISNLFINGMVLGVIYGGGYLMSNNEINAGQLMAYLTATQMIQKSFSQFSILFGTALRGMSSGGRVFEVNFNLTFHNIINFNVI